MRQISILGKIDLSDCVLEFPLIISECEFDNVILLHRVTLNEIVFAQSKLKGVEADAAKLRGDFALKDGTEADGEIQLPGAEIGKNIYIHNAKIRRAGGRALNLDGARVSGSIVVDDNTQIDGELNMLRCRIGGQLKFAATTIRNPEVEKRGGLAVIADNSKIDGQVVFENGVIIEGLTRFVGASIGGDLYACGLVIQNGDKPALQLDGVTIAGSFRLVRDWNRGQAGFSKIVGETLLYRASVSGDVECSGTLLSRPSNLAFNADGAQIGGSLSLSNELTVEGQVTIASARIGRDLFLLGATFKNPGGWNLNCVGVKIMGAAVLREFSADGKLNFFAAQVGTYFEFLKLIPPLPTEMDLRYAKVQTYFDDRKSWPRLLHLTGLQYERISGNEDIFNPKNSTGEADPAALRIEWLKRQPTDIIASQTYQQLSSTLKSMGHEDAAVKVLIEKNRALGAQAPFLSLSWFWFKVFGPLIGFGYRPGNAFLASLLVIGMGTLIFRWAHNQRLIGPSSDSAFRLWDTSSTIIGSLPGNIPLFNALAFSFETFTPLVKLDQAQSWTPIASRKGKIPWCQFKCPVPSRVIQWYLRLHILLGWTLTSLWVSALTGIVKG